jgi:hypothetical protein
VGRRLRSLAPVLVALALPLAVCAHAARSATEEERAAVALAVGVEPACARVSVSTVDESWSLFRGVLQADCPPSDGWIALRRQPDATWTVESQGPFDDPACPTFRVPPPRPVALDLRLCHRPRSYLLCLPSIRARDRELRERPRSCNTLGRGDALAFAVNLVRLRWRGWGRPVARARGIERGFHLPLARIPVRVKVYRRRPVCGGDLLYTRLRATSRYGTSRIRLPARCGD